MLSLKSKFIMIILALAYPLGALALEAGGVVTTDQTWRLGDSPVDVTSMLTIENGATILIEAGVTVRFGPMAGIIVHGDLRAYGREGTPILFTALEGSEAGSWGGLYFRNPGSEKSYDSQLKPTGKGSYLLHSEIEFGGSGEVESGSVLGTNSASPYFENLSIRNSKGITGTVRCLNSSEPLFVNCRIVGNVSTRGGAISSSVGSKPILIGCSLLGNRAIDNGGAIYLSLADLHLRNSVISGNSAGSDGGAIYAARVSDLTLIDNVFDGNRADGGGSNILLISDQVGATIKGNTFESSGTAIKLQKAGVELNVAGNYWGNPGLVNFGELFHDRAEDKAEPLVVYAPSLFAPSTTTPVTPSKIDRIILCRNDSYTDPIPRGVANGAPVRIRLEGTDVNPGFIDLIPVTITSEIDPTGIQVCLTENGENSGIFTGRATVAMASDQKGFLIGSREGGSISIFNPGMPDVKANYPTLTPKPTVGDLAIASAADITHLTDHKPEFTWSYYEPVDRPQKSFKIEVTNERGKQVWRTGDVNGDQTSIVYDGTSMEDGEAYVMEISVNSGKFWSDPATLSFRMNSLPTAPLALRPIEASLNPTRSPQLAVGIANDREGDALTYSFELEDVSGGTEKQEVSGLKGSNEVVWTAGKALTENGTYRFRANASDPFETGAWGDYRLFYVNATEEAPLAFEAVSPNGADVFDLHPTFDWQTAVDPDPLSSVIYTSEVAKGGNWAQGRKYDGISATSFKLPDSLDNKAEYQWRVTATDNTGRKTESSKPGRFRVETTPSIPQITSPKSGEERKPEATLAWNPSTDPNPSDVLTYEIEVFKDAASPKILASRYGWSGTNVAVNQLQGWESLNDNTIYQWRVKARDNHNAASEFSSTGSFFNNARNDTPTPPATVTAPTANVTGTTTVTFGWQPGTDADLSDGTQTLIYEVEAVVGTFDSGDVRRFRSGQGDVELAAALDDNKVWKYRIRTIDDDGAGSGWTATKEVLVNFAEDAPTAFGLATPVTGETVTELDSIRFTWSASSDPDWNSSVKYRLEITGADGKVVKYETSATTYLHKSALANESTYSWKVTAIDNTSRETACTNDFTVRTNTTPSIPGKIDPSPELLPNGRLSWGSSTDPNPRDRLVYTFDIAADESFGTLLVHKEAIAHTDGMIGVTINALAGWEKLQDDRDYVFRVRATDNHGYSSAWSSPLRFRYNLANDAPTVPAAPLAPTAGVVITDRSPVLKWAASTDEDLSDPINSLIYDVRLDADGELTKNALYDFSTAPGATQFSVPMPLTDNSPWVWSVRAKDDGGAVSAWSPVQSFMLNVQEDAPTAPVGVKPYNGQSLNVLGPISFGWMRSMDPDYKSSVAYRVEYGTSADLSGATTSADLKDSTFTVQGPLENTTYYWRILARDNTGIESKSSVNSFILDTRPTVPQAAMPNGGVEFRTDGRFAWSGSADPNPSDVITYTMQISSDAGFGSITVELTGLKETTIMVSAPGLKGKLADNQRYYWRVKATDNHKVASVFGSSAEFVYNEKNDAPSGFDLATPANGSSLPIGEIKLNWGNASDPDPGSRVAYTLIFARDAKFNDRAQRFTSLATGQFTIPAAMIEAGAKYYWKVSAEDGLGGVSYGSGSDKTPWSFQIETPPPPPPPPPPTPPAPVTPAPGQ